MESYLAQALLIWNSPESQALLVPLRTLSSISAMFWMLARLSNLLMAALRRLIFTEISTMLSAAYAIVLSVVYAAMMFNTAMQGQWHPSLLWREICGFGFMYIMLGVTFTDLSTRRLKPHTPLAFFLGVCAYLFLSGAPALARHPALVEFHRVLELFATGGWGNVMTAFTALVMLGSLLTMAVSEAAFGLSPLLYRLRIIKVLPVRFNFSRPGCSRGAVPSLARSWFILTLLVGGAGMMIYWWPKLRAAGEAAAPALQGRAQSPEAAAAAAKLRRVLPAVSFTAVSALPRRGTMADLAAPVFRSLLSAPGEADRWLAAAALDRLDPDFRISQADLFRSTAAAALPCAWKGRSFKVLMLPLPGDAPDKTRTYWISDDRGVHFTGVGPGELREVAGSTTCAVAAFGSGGSLLLAFTEAPQGPGAAPQLWLSAYDPKRREVIASVRAGGNASGNFELAAAGSGVVWADAPVSSAAAGCSGSCGRVLGAPVRSLTIEPLVEYRGAMVSGDAIKIVPLSDRTFKHSGLARNYKSLSHFETTFRFDPVAGFLARWYHLARLADGRRCVSLSLDPALPGFEESAVWSCDR
ncbi:MAG: hypothetical protein COT18_11715 [Elusimicrobia bacterium CG08_land_8_20_14_0_20_59_10]|nr:MAG: hypothetical protein COT18_11715 [Elusimicrobia bacterium CG08_land_8_20_14_0_20_59_10]